MLIRIGFCGSHRTGKTTLAQALAKKLGLIFLQTKTSDVFRENGIDPSIPMDFQQRLWIQSEIIGAAEEIWKSEKGSFVTDRTPIDMLAYTLADIKGDTVVNFEELKKYIAKCYELSNKYFTDMFIVQPGIPLIYEPGKASLNFGYIELLNSVIVGLCFDERLKCNSHIVNRKTLDLNERLLLISGIINNVIILGA